ncbi:hypothetical protein MKZ38_010108 [Zalerion maritima]|uniref:Uncharacterized protein n=1 Tax=Zalerion maritima TaxID=339359 RepID=A0AAD5RTJ5_9PEZI|nr:hypothetical protein MKZ38_010108 [Zalerion maritima]
MLFLSAILPKDDFHALVADLVMVLPRFFLLLQQPCVAAISSAGSRTTPCPIWWLTTALPIIVKWPLRSPTPGEGIRSWADAVGPHYMLQRFEDYWRWFGYCFHDLRVALISFVGAGKLSVDSGNTFDHYAPALSSWLPLKPAGPLKKFVTDTVRHPPRPAVRRSAVPKTVSSDSVQAQTGDNTPSILNCLPTTLTPSTLTKLVTVTHSDSTKTQRMSDESND